MTPAWPAGFWPNGFVPTGFFGPEGEGGLPGTLVEAIRAAVGSALVAAPEGAPPPDDGLDRPLSWFGADLAPAGTALPYANYGEPDEDDTPWDALGAEEARGTIAVQVFAGTKVGARALGDRLRATLYDAEAAGGLEFTDGRLFRFRQSGRSAVQDPDTDELGDPVWVETRLFEFRYTQ